MVTLTVSFAGNQEIEYGPFKQEYGKSMTNIANDDSSPFSQPRKRILKKAKEFFEAGYTLVFVNEKQRLIKS